MEIERCLEVWPIPANMTRFHHLIKLDLMVFLIKLFNLLSAAFILNAAPHLQKFHLALQGMVVHDDQVTWEFSEQLYPQLKEVELSGFRDECNLLGLATYLLKNAVGLERMIISSKTKMYHVAGRWTYSTFDLMTKAEKDRVHAVLSKEKVRENVELIIVQ